MPGLFISGAMSVSLVLASACVYAQMPFYTDDTSVTAPKKLHVEVFDELDGLQSSQFQGMFGLQYAIRDGLTLCVGILIDADAGFDDPELPLSGLTFP